MVPLSALHSALVAFAQLASREAIPRAWRHLVAPDSLGRLGARTSGTTEPAEAFARLDAVDSQYGRTTRWETTATRRGWWRGRVTVAHDPALETRRLVAAWRDSRSWRPCPALFGYPDATARIVAAEGATNLVQEYEVSWAVLRRGDQRGDRRRHRPGARRGADWWLTSAPLGLHAARSGGGGRDGDARGHRQGARSASARREPRAADAGARSRAQPLAPRVARDGRRREARGIGRRRPIPHLCAAWAPGATGVIYEAVRISDGQRVAIKLLRVAAAHDAVASDRLRREAEALGLSWHPNVVEVIDHGHLPDGTTYLVMELLAGRVARRAPASRGRLTSRELLPIALQMCDALVAGPRGGRRSSGLKPSNILSHRARRRGGPRARQAARLRHRARRVGRDANHEHGWAPRNAGIHVAGARETGGRRSTAERPLRARRRVLFECLVGEPPPPRSPSGLVRMAESSSASRRDSGTQKAAAFTTPGWRAVLDKAMALHPADRYADARAFAQDLRAVREDLVEASS